jgi:hypothetical protein
LSDYNRSFIEIALKTRLDGDKLTVANSSQLAVSNLNDYDVVINTLENISNSEKNRLKSYLENGGSIISFANDEFENFSDFYESIGFTQVKENKFTNKIKFNKVEKLHPLFSDLFSGSSDNRQIVESPEIEKMNTVKGGFTLIEANNLAFMNELKVGDGKIIYFAVSQDLNWSNFPLTGLFPALLNKSIIYLSSDKGNFNKSQDNEKVLINISKNKALDNNFTIISPSGQESVLKANSLPSGSLLIIDDVSEIGSYSIKNSKGEFVAVFSLNHNPNESNSEYYTSEEVKDKLSNIMKNIRIEVVEDYNDFDLNSLRASLGTELWQLFLILALLCGIAELFVQKAYKNEFE